MYEGGEDFSKGFIELKPGRDLTIFASGIMVSPCLRVARELEGTGFSVAVVDLFRIKPLPDEINTMYSGTPILTVENHNEIGGIGSALCELFATDNTTAVHRLGVHEKFGQVGKVPYLLSKYGIDEKGIKEKILSIIEK